MSIPFDVDALVRGDIIESSRLECKSGLNPERVMHTITAFANDIDNTGGGFVIIGIEERDGSMVVSGLNPKEIDADQKEIVRICNYISPRYVPVIDVHDFDGKKLLILWVPAGNNRPYSCPSHLGKNESSNRVYYIRKGSSTIEANSHEAKDLFDASRTIPFDDCPNPEAEMMDLLPSLMAEFLYATNCDTLQDTLKRDPLDVANRLRLVGSIMGVKRPLNVGLMFFNEDPERFFRCTRIEVVDKPDPTGQGMSERVFRGPIDRQLRDALQYIRNYILVERVYKHDDTAEAERFFNYPYAAIEETLVNAMYHRSYEIPEPVTVVFESDRMTITSIPGPDRSISDSDLEAGILVCKRYRNRRIGDFLRELHLAEERNTGIPKVIRALERNGSGRPRFLTDEDRTYFTVEIPVHPDFIRTSKVVRTQNERRLEDMIVDLLAQSGCRSMKEISESLGYSGINRKVRDTVIRLIGEGVLEYLYPDKPRSPLQRICLVNRRGRS